VIYHSQTNKYSKRPKNAGKKKNNGKRAYSLAKDP
jgi:hypothetical protein